MSDSEILIRQVSPGESEGITLNGRLGWPSYRLTQMLAVLIGLLPFYAFIIWSHLTRESPYTLQDLFLYPLIVGSLGIVWMVFLYTTLCGERLSGLNLRVGRWSRDLLMGSLLTVGLFVWKFFEGMTVSQWLPRQAPPPEILNLIIGLAESPSLLALWLGPVVWVGVAGFEELGRVFMLNRLWCAWDHPAAQWVFLVLSAVLFGFAHIYQGPQGAVSVGVIGLILGIAYRLCGRVWPLVISHALFDSIQITWVVVQIRSGAIV